MVRECQRENLFTSAAISPAVPQGLARLRATVTAAHTRADLDFALDVLKRAGQKVGIL